MTPRIGAAVAAITVLVAAAMAGVFSGDDAGDDEPTPPGQYETTRPTEAGSRTGGDADDEPSTTSTFSDTEAAEQTPAEPPPVGMPVIDPAATASAFGCGYAAHPRGETASEHALRLAHLATADLTSAVADLSVNGFGDLTVTAEPGAVTKVPGTQDWWEVRCVTATVRPDGTPAAPPGAVLLQVRVTRQADGAWRAAELAFPGTG